MSRILFNVSRQLRKTLDDEVNTKSALEGIIGTLLLQLTSGRPVTRPSHNSTASPKITKPSERLLFLGQLLESFPGLGRCFGINFPVIVRSFVSLDSKRARVSGPPFLFPVTVFTVTSMIPISHKLTSVIDTTLRFGFDATPMFIIHHLESLQTLCLQQEENQSWFELILGEGHCTYII